MKCSKISFTLVLTAAPGNSGVLAFDINSVVLEVIYKSLSVCDISGKFTVVIHDRIDRSDIYALHTSAFRPLILIL